MPILKVGNKRRHRGFTLIEIIVSIVLLAAMMAILVPQFHHAYKNSTLKSTVRSIAGNFRFARASAISLNKARIIKIDSAKNYFFIEENGGVKIPKSIKVKPRRPNSGRSSGVDEVIFYPHGGSSGAALVLHNERIYFLLEVNPITGKVDVNDYAPQ